MITNPDETLDEQRHIAADIAAIQTAIEDTGQATDEQIDRQSELGVRLANLVIAFDAWIVKGGDYPKDWRYRAGVEYSNGPVTGPDPRD